MIHISCVLDQSSKHPVPLEALEEIFSDKDVFAKCNKYRETNANKDKQELYLLHASDRYFFIDIDGENHEKGNTNIDFEKITCLIPHVAWFKSPSGKGLKLLIEVDRDIHTDERDKVRRYLLDTIKDLTGLVIDYSRADVAFVSDQPITFSHMVFNIPSVFDEEVNKVSRSRKDPLGTTGAISHNFSILPELLDNCPDRTDYNKWLAIVMSILRVFGSPAIELLEKKWPSQIPYDTLLKYADDYDFGILEQIWKFRIRKNAKRAAWDYIRRVITGATGAGKSEFAIKEMKFTLSEADSGYSKYFIYVVPSVKQAIDFSKKLKREGITYEIIVSTTTYKNLNEEEKSKVDTVSSNNKEVKIIQLAALKNNSQYLRISTDNRKLCTMYIDELTLLDFIRPSLYSSDLVNAYTGIETSNELLQYYRRNFSRSDLEYAERLLATGDHSHFVSSMLFQEVDTTVLTTEELTTTCLEALKFEKTVIKKKETKTLKDTCTLHVSDSSYYVLECVQSELLQNQLDEMQFDNIFANKCEFATGNLMTIKGQHLAGKNLSIIRCLPRVNVSAIHELFRHCFWSLEDIDPVALFYKDSLMQAVGRSIGFRGETEAWVMIHSSIWEMIKDTEWIYSIENWNVPIDPELKKQIDESRVQQKSLMRDAYADKVKHLRNEKFARIKLELVATGDPKDILKSKDIKQIFGAGYKLTDVAECFNVSPKKNKSCYLLEGIKQL